MNISQGEIDEFYVLVGKNIAKQRKILGLNQEEFGNRLGLSRTSVVNIEKGRQKASLHLIYAMLVIFDIEISKIFPLISQMKTRESLDMKMEKSIKDDFLRKVLLKNLG